MRWLPFRKAKARRSNNALLVYLLRQAGVPAAYVYPPNGGLQMLDFQANKPANAVERGELAGANQSAAVHRPELSVGGCLHRHELGADVSVAQITEIVEGFNYDYMPTNYNSGFKWMKPFIDGDTNIFSLSDSDQPFRFAAQVHPEEPERFALWTSVDDMGVQIVNRKHLYAQWGDFPSRFHSPARRSSSKA